MKRLLLLLTALCIPNIVHCAAISSTASGGAWEVGATWVGGVAPVGGVDTATIVQFATVTINGNITIGNGAGTALTINGFLFVPNTIATSSMTIIGNCTLSGTTNAKWWIGTSTAPLPASSVFTVCFYCASADQWTLTQTAGAAPSQLKWYGDYTYDRIDNSSMSYVSRTTSNVTASSNSVTIERQNGWFPGRDVYIMSTNGVVTQGEFLTISTTAVVGSSLTFTTNFAYTHSTGAYIFDMSRNIKLTTRVSAYRPKVFLGGDLTTFGNNSIFAFDNVAVSSMGATTTMSFYNQIAASDTTRFRLTNCAFYQVSCFANINCRFGYTSDSVFIKSSNDTGVVRLTNGLDAYFARCYIVANVASGLSAVYDSGSSGCVWDDCHIYNFAYGLDMHSYGSTWNNLKMGWFSSGEFICNAAAATVNTVINNYVYEGGWLVAGALTTWLTAITGDVTFNNPDVTLRPTAVIKPETSDQSSGFKLKLNSYNLDPSSSSVWLGGGHVNQDTTTYRSAYPSLRFVPRPLSAWNTVVSFTLPANKNDSIMVRGFTQKYSGYGSANLPYCKISTLDGYINTITSMTDTSDSWVGWIASGVSNSTTTVTIELGARSLTAGTTVHFDDVRAYIGNNVYSLGKVWTGGYPMSASIATTVDASNVWNASTGTYMLAGTFGYNAGTNLDAKISTINTNLNIASNTIVSAVYASSGAAVDLSSVQVQLSTSTTAIINAVYTSSGSSGVSLSTGTIADSVWDTNVIDEHQTPKSAGKVLRDIRRRVP
jgi:hypothetical protein